VLLPLRDSIPSRHPAFVNWALIVANVAVFVYEVRLPPEHLEALVGRWGIVPLAYRPGEDALPNVLPRLPNFITAMFLHGGIGHLFGNMLFLWIFGDNIEDRLGHVRYLVFYLSCGIVASLVQVVSDLDSGIPIIGASGAIGGVMGAYLLLFPHARVLTLFFIIIIVRLIWIPAVVYLGVWFLIQLIEALNAPPGVGAGVAFWAHVGGFVAGVVWIVVLRVLPGQRFRGA
jgi:membrane associated rhomboid family serine protease